MTSNKDGRQQNPHDSGQRRLFLTLICTNHPQFVLWVETFLVFVTTIKFRNLLTTWALTSCDLTIFFHGHKNNGLLPLFDENKYINNMFLLILIKRWYYLTRLEDHKTRMIPDNRLFSTLICKNDNLFRGWKHFWFLSLPSRFEIYLLGFDEFFHREKSSRLQLVDEVS